MLVTTYDVEHRCDLVSWLRQKWTVLGQSRFERVGHRWTALKSENGRSRVKCGRSVGIDVSLHVSGLKISNIVILSPTFTIVTIIKPPK